MDRAFPRMSPSPCSSRSAARRRKGSASGSRSAVRSWSPGADACGSREPERPERNSASVGREMQPFKASPLNGPVFIVDDEPAVLDGLRLMLSTFGYACRTFASAEDFLATVPVGSNRCLIAHLLLPGM